MGIKKGPVRFFIFIILVSLFLGISCTNRDSTATVPKILIVYSYHAEYPWVQSIDKAIMDTLKDTDCRLERFYMDTKRNASASFKEKAGKKALEMVETFKPEVVITADDNAQQFFARFLVGRDDLSVVFCGVNNEPEKYDFPAKNVTGVLERPNYIRSLRLLKKVSPGLSSVTFLTDNSPTSVGVIRYIKSLHLDVKIDGIISTDSFEKWKSEYQNVQSDAILTFVYHTIKDKGGNYVLPKDVMAWCYANMTKPVVGVLDFAIEDGCLLGCVESGYEQGEMAAKMVIKILDGKMVRDMPIVTADKGLIVVNVKTAKKLDIDLSPLVDIIDQKYQ
ncbi:MAG: hypothetical protein GY757_16610 [bacterium]|nr:hypothetical protein [bacterium]